MGHVRHSYAWWVVLLVFVVRMAVVQTQASADGVNHKDLNTKLNQVLQKLDALQNAVDELVFTFPGDGVQGAPLRFQDNSDGTLTDLNTGLMWEKKVAGSGCLHCVEDVYTFADALSIAPGSFLNRINTEGGTGLGGHRDWRLPNIRELTSIVDYSGFSPAIVAVFNNGPDSLFNVEDAYWSSTLYAQEPLLSAWGVEFNFGQTEKIPLVGRGGRPGFFVRAVRSGR